MRVVVISRGHPEIEYGSDDMIAAYNLYKGINRSPGHQAWFVARAAQRYLHLGDSLAKYSDREYLIPGDANYVDLSTKMELGSDSDFAVLLRRLKPDVINFHHYHKLGVELIRVARRARPSARIILTLHDYIAICARDVTIISGDTSERHRYMPTDYMNGFAGKGPDWFFLRQRYIKSFFGLADMFITPSRFLAKQYINWGIPREKLEVAASGVEPGARIRPRNLARNAPRTRFAFFGKAEPDTGLDFVLEALAGLSEELKKAISLDVYVDGMDEAGCPYVDRLELLMERAASFTQFHKPDRRMLTRQIEASDWVLLGDLGWDCSLHLIQESWKIGRPLIGPDSESVAELVTHGIGGLMYRTGDMSSLRELIVQILRGALPFAYADLQSRLPEPVKIDETVAAYLQLYSR